MFIPEVNFISVIIAAVSNMIIGALWYSPMLFGTQWMKLVGLTEKDMIEAKEKGMGKTYGATFAGALAMAYALAVIVHFSGAVTVDQSIKLALIVWVGFIAASKLSDVLFGKKPLKLFYIESGYYLVAITVMSVILTYII